MDELYILRHGIAVDPGTPGIADDDRPLTPKGRKRMREIGRGLRRMGLDIDQVISSPLPRASETAEIVADALDARNRLEFDDALRSGVSAGSIRDWLRNRPPGRLMIVGHNPSFSDLVGLLVVGDGAPDGFCDLKKGGIAALRAAGNGSDRFTIDWIATPRLLRRP